MAGERGVVVPVEIAPEGPASGQGANVVTLDAIRAVAALGVLIFHLQPLMFLQGKDIPGAVLGQTGVLVFFVLSGYLIGGSVLRPEHFSTRNYLIRRAARILPLYYLSVALVLLVDSSWLLSEDGLVDLLLHLLLIHGLFRDNFTSIYAVWWTLSAEWLFYLLMAVVAPWFRRPRAGWAVAVAFIVIGIGWRIQALSSPDLDRPFTAQIVIGWLDVFGLGMLAALAVRTEWGQRALLRRAVRIGGLLMALAGMALAAAVYLARSPASPYLYWRSRPMVVAWPFFAAGAVALLVVVAPTFERYTRRIITRSGLAYLGAISYGIYVFHPLIIQSFSRSWRAVEPTMSPWVLVPLVFGGTVLAAALSHRLVERPAMEWGRAQTRAVRRKRVGTR